MSLPYTTELRSVTAASVAQAFDVVEKLGRQDGALLARPRASGN